MDHHFGIGGVVDLADGFEPVDPRRHGRPFGEVTAQLGTRSQGRVAERSEGVAHIGLIGVQAGQRVELGLLLVPGEVAGDQPADPVGNGTNDISRRLRPHKRSLHSVHRTGVRAPVTVVRQPLETKEARCGRTRGRTGNGS